MLQLPPSASLTLPVSPLRPNKGRLVRRVDHTCFPRPAGQNMVHPPSRPHPTRLHARPRPLLATTSTCAPPDDTRNVLSWEFCLYRRYPTRSCLNILPHASTARSGHHKYLLTTRRDTYLMYHVSMPSLMQILTIT